MKCPRKSCLNNSPQGKENYRSFSFKGHKPTFVKTLLFKPQWVLEGTIPNTVTPEHYLDETTNFQKVNNNVFFLTHVLTKLKDDMFAQLDTKKLFDSKIITEKICKIDDKNGHSHSSSVETHFRACLTERSWCKN